MSTNNTQIGHTPSEPFIIDMETETNLEQLLSTGILTTTSQPSISLNLTNMIPSQIPMISNHQEDEISRRTRETQQRREQQRQQREQQREQQRQEREQQRQEQQRQQRERQIRRQEKRDRRFSRWLDTRYEWYREQDQRREERRAHFEYLRQRSPTFDEHMEDRIEQQLLEAYDLEKMDPKERWLHENLNEMERIYALEQQELIKDEVEQLDQINDIETYDNEKLERINIIKERDQQRLQQFEGIPPATPPVSIEDEIEQLRQIEEFRRFEKEKLKYMKTRTAWDQEQLRDIERIPIPAVNDPIYDSLDQLPPIDDITQWLEEEQEQRTQEELQQWEHMASILQQQN